MLHLETLDLGTRVTPSFESKQLAPQPPVKDTLPPGPGCHGGFQQSGGIQVHEDLRGDFGRQDSNGVDVKQRRQSVNDRGDVGRA